jgi:hypothetical protein
MSLPSGTYSGLSSKQNRWTSDLMGSGVQEWFPPEGKDAGVEHYFTTASSLIESECPGQGFHFHFTANIDTVPVTGPKSVVFVMSEENGLLPRYTGSVDAVFKCYGAKFVPTAQWLWNHPSLLTSCLARDAVVLRRILLARWRWWRNQDRPNESFASATVHHIPLGYHSLPPAEIPPWEHRANDVFFAGSIRQAAVERKLLPKIPNPKQVVRNDMAESLKRLAAEKHWRLKLLLAESFVPHAVAWGLATEGSTISTDQYMREMANPEFVLLRGERPWRPSDTTKPRLSGASSFLTGCRTRGFIGAFPFSSSKTGEKSIRFLTACRRTSLNFEHFMSRHSDGGSIGCHPLL